MTSHLPPADARAVRRLLMRLARDNRKPVGTMLVLFTLAALLGVVGPQLLGVLVDRIASGRPVPIDRLAVAFLLVLALQTIASGLAHVRAAAVGEQLLATTRERFVARVLRLPVGVVEAAGTGELLSRATTDVERMDYAARFAAPQILTSLITVAVTVVAMLVTSPLLSTAALVSVPVIALSTRWYRARSARVLEPILAAWGEVQASSTESVLGARTVDTLGLGGRRIEHHWAALQSAVTFEHAHRRLLTRWIPCLEMSSLLPVVVVLLLGGWAYAHGKADLGELTAVTLYVLALSAPVNVLLTWFEELQIGDAALRRILGVQGVKPESDDPGSAPAGHDIELCGVRFSYVPGREVLHGIDLSIPAGEHLAVLGPSGSGKSTVARLIAGLSTPDSGTITLGGVDVMSLSHDQLRTKILLLTQEHHVFAGSVRDNLLLPEGEWNDDDLRAALDVVGAGDWLRALPRGLDTRLGAGEHPAPPAVAQRLALARVVLADPPVVLLDEATAAFTGATARDLDAAVSAALAGRTVISIAHRLDVARRADRILVLLDGRIAELGDHRQLLARGGSYAHLVTATEQDEDTPVEGGLTHLRGAAP